MNIKKHVLQTHRSLHIEAQNSCDEVQELHVSPNQNKKQHRDNRKTEGPISTKEATGNDSFLDKEPGYFKTIASSGKSTIFQ